MIGTMKHSRRTAGVKRERGQDSKRTAAVKPDSHHEMTVEFRVICGVKQGHGEPD